jgi:hypothetical protein
MPVFRSIFQMAVASTVFGGVAKEGATEFQNILHMALDEGE